MFNPIKIIATSSLCLFLLNNTVDASNPNLKQLGGKVQSRSRTFKLAEGVSVKNYRENIVIVKINPDQKANCQVNKINLSSLQKTFNLLGVDQTNAKFPNASVSTLKMFPGQEAVDLTTIFELHYTAQVNVVDAINEILKSEDVVYAEPAYIYFTDHTPNDPDTASGHNYFQKIIKAYEAWDISKGDTNTVIGIVDTGGDLDHPDLAANVKYNYADPMDGIDNDNDGYIDNFKGWDMVGPVSSNFVPDGDPNVQSGGNDHGVHVGGDASAVSNNGIGISGIGYKCKLLFIKCTPDVYENAIYTGYEGIVYAADHGASIINCSWGGAGGGSFGQDVINYAIIKGALVVAAAGNDGIDIAQFPSSYKGVLSVASSTSTDKASGFTSFNYTVDVMAPGSNIFSTTFNNSYNSYDGTSMASPITAGAAAIVKSHFPNLNGLQVGELLRVTSDDVYSKSAVKYKDKLGKGRINLLRALTITSPSIRATNMTLIDKNNGALLSGDTVSLMLNLTNFLQATSNLTATITTTSTAITLLNSSINPGVISTMQTFVAQPFKFVVKAGVTENTKVNFKIAYADGTYVDAEFFSIEVNISSVNITVNQVQSTATGIGRVGYRNGDGTGGLGFVYNGTSMLYEAALMVAQSPTLVSNNARSDATTPDENFVVTKRVSQYNEPGIDFISKGEFNDANALIPQNLLIKHREFAWSQLPNDKYIMVEYKIKNNNPNAITGMYAGLFLDWDIVSSATNRLIWDDSNKMGVAMSTGVTDPLGAVKVLSNFAPVAYYGQSYSIIDGLQNDGFTLADKYTTLSSGIVNDSVGFTGTGLDVQYTIGAGPYTVNPNEDAVIAFAFIGGDNLADLQASAQAAQNKYNAVVLNLSVNQSKSDLFSLKLSPNPSNNKVGISFQLNEPAVAKIIVRDELGRIVKTIAKGNWYTGPYQFDADINDLKAGIYLVSLESLKGIETVKLIVY